MVMWYDTKANIASCGLSHSSIYQTQTIISDLFNFQGDIFLKIFQKEQKGFFFYWKHTAISIIYLCTTSLISNEAQALPVPCLVSLRQRQ